MLEQVTHFPMVYATYIVEILVNTFFVVYTKDRRYMLILVTAVTASMTTFTYPSEVRGNCWAGLRTPSHTAHIGQSVLGVIPSPIGKIDASQKG